MKRYDFYGPESGPGIEEREDGEWVPAEVAQALYDALESLRSDIGIELWKAADADKALALADGEE